MKHKLFALLSLLILASMVLAACGGGATDVPATQPPAPVVTEPPATEAPTEAPTAEPTAIPDVPIATFDGSSLSVPAEECNADYIGLVQSVVATDASTVTFTLCRPDPAFLSKIAFNPFGIYPSEWIESTAGDGVRTSEGLEHPVGTGPYMVDEWARGENITFTTFPDYWGTPAIADTLVFRWSTEAAARLLELQAGTVDGIDNVGQTDAAVITADPTLQLTPRPALNVMYFGFTNTFKPFNNVKVRQALAMGIDRQRIVDNFYPLGSTVATHFTPCSIPNACVGDVWYDFDPVAAKALLAEGLAEEGLPTDSFSTKLYYRDVTRSYATAQGTTLQDLQAQLKDNLNIDSEIIVMQSGEFVAAAFGGTLDGIFLLGWGADYPHITNFLDFHFGASNAEFGTSYPEITDALTAGGQIPDPAEAEPFYVTANNAIRALVPMVPIVNSASATAYRADVVNPQASPLNAELFYVSDPGGRDIFNWMQNAEPISMFCADESDGESLRACEQVVEPLYTFEINGTAVVPVLATACTANAELTVWTCALREGVTFHDGSTFDAADVVATFNMGLNIGSPFHVGNTGLWQYYDSLWGLMKKPGG